MKDCVVVAEVEGWKSFINECLRDRARRSNGGWAHYFLARVSSEEAGLLVLDILDRPSSGVVREIFVAPNFRQRGVADELLRHAQTAAERRLLPTLELEVYPLDVETNKEGLIRWYRRCGFIENPDQESKLVKRLSGFAG